MVAFAERIGITHRHPDEVGASKLTKPDVLNPKARRAQLATINLIRECASKTLLTEMGLSEKRRTWRHEEGVANTFVQDVVSRAIEVSPHVNNIFQEAAGRHLKEQYDATREVFNSRVQTVKGSGKTDCQVVVFTHLMHDTDTLGGKIKPKELIAFGKSLIRADERAGNISDAELAKHALVDYVVNILYLGKLNRFQRARINSYDSALLLEHARDMVQSQFEGSLFAGDVDEKVAARLSSAADQILTHPDILLGNPTAYATVTVFEQTPFKDRGVSGAMSPIDRAYGSAVRQIVEAAYLKAVTTKLFPQDSQVTRDLEQVLNFLVRTGRFKSDNVAVIRGIRQKFQSVENHIENVMLGIADNVMESGIALAQTQHNITRVLRSIDKLDRKSTQRLVDSWINKLAIDFANGQNVGKIDYLELQAKS